VAFPSKRFLSAAIIFVNLFHFRPSILSAHTLPWGKKKRKKKKKKIAIGSILPEHVQTVQGDISANVPEEDSDRKPIARLEERLVKLPRLCEPRRCVRA
jgi:hypothetical protein